jgi:hypothetical protein
VFRLLDEAEPIFNEGQIDGVVEWLKKRRRDLPKVVMIPSALCATLDLTLALLPKGL